MSQQILVSVVMPVYNAELYLAEAIESILNQTYTNFEFIIIDDGSTDSSDKIICHYKKLDNRIVHVKNENQGISLTLNNGIKIAKGKYIARMDADDISHKERFEYQVSFMEKNKNIGVCGTWTRLFGEIKPNQFSLHPVKDSALKVKLLLSVCFSHPTVFIRRDLLISTNTLYNPDYTSAQDYDLWERLSTLTSFANIPKVLLDYRVTANSVSAKANNDKSDKRFNLIAAVNQRVLNRLGVKLNDEEKVLFYLLGLNSRLKNNDIAVFKMNKLIDNIFYKNKYLNQFSKHYLLLFLSERYFYAVIFNSKAVKFLSFFSVFFLIGLFSMVVSRVKQKVLFFKLYLNF